MSPSSAPSGSVTARTPSGGRVGGGVRLGVRAPALPEPVGDLERAAALATLQQEVGAERAGGDDDAAYPQRLAVLAQPRAGALVDDLVALAAVGCADRPDVDDRALGADLDPASLGEPQVVLLQRVLPAHRAADHAAPDELTPGPRRALATEERIRAVDA